MKSKLSPGDLDDILKILKTRDVKMDSFTKYDNRSSTNSTNSSNSSCTNATNGSTNQQLQGNPAALTDSSIDGLNSNIELNGDMDSTLIGGDTSVNLNTSTTA